MTLRAKLASILAGLLTCGLCNASHASTEHDEDLFEIGDHHAAHQHGLAHAYLSLEDSILYLMLVIAADDVISPAHSGQSQTQIESAVQMLAQFDQLFSVPYHCTATSTPSADSLRNIITQLKPGHNDLSMQYQWHCAKPITTEMEFMLFDTLPSIKNVNVQFISEQVQRTALLNAKNRHFSLAP